jgi:SAM-dependent methyltransferase
LSPTQLSQPADSQTKRFRRYFLYSWLTNPDAHRNYLRRVYADSLARARQTQPDLFRTGEGHFLLCGVGSVNTAETFCRFALKTAPAARITLFDVRPEVLEKSRARLRACRIGGTNQITLQMGDALRLPFAAESFDWIETDNFLQFFRKEELPQLAAGWHEILKPGGWFTTRQIFLGSGWGDVFGRLLWQSYSRIISAPCHEHCPAEVARQLERASFRVANRWQPARSFKQIHSLAAFRP